MEKLRVGFLIDDMNVDYYVRDLINFVYNDKCFETPVLITGYKKPNDKLNKKLFLALKSNPAVASGKVMSWLLLKLIQKIERPFVVKKFPSHGSKTELSFVSSVEQVLVDGLYSKSGLFLSFTEEDIVKVSSCKLDCIIRCGSGILRGDILKVAKFGVLSLHHCDDRLIRGGPGGFWEVLNNEPSSGFVIQKLNEELDGGEILVRGNLMTQSYWTANNAQLLEKSNEFFKILLKDLFEKRKLPVLEDVRLYGNMLFKLGSWYLLAKYIIKVLTPLVLGKIKAKILSPEVDRWSIAYSKHKNFSKSLFRYQEIENPIGRSLADPFIYEKDNEHFIFVEDLFFSDNKGRISVIRVEDEKYEFLGVVLEESFHLSFPFIFDHDGEVFMVPETHQSNDIRLYRCEIFPMKWTLDTVLIDGISAADTMIFKIDGQWFLFTNKCSSGSDDHHSELHIFYSNNLKSKEWQPIKKGNPVIFDSMNARNAGYFFHNNNMYRVNQIHGKSHYGKAFSVNKVTHISDEDFIEEKVSTVQACFKKDISSTHHYSANTKFAVIDFCRKQRLKDAKKS